MKINFNTNGFAPVIVQDFLTLHVLMLGFMNENAFEQTQNSGKVTFLVAVKTDCGLKEKHRVIFNCKRYKN